VAIDWNTWGAGGGTAVQFNAKNKNNATVTYQYNPQSGALEYKDGDKWKPATADDQTEDVRKYIKAAQTQAQKSTIGTTPTDAENARDPEVQQAALYAAQAAYYRLKSEGKDAEAAALLDRIEARKDELGVKKEEIQVMRSTQRDQANVAYQNVTARYAEMANALELTGRKGAIDKEITALQISGQVQVANISGATQRDVATIQAGSAENVARINVEANKEVNRAQAGYYNAQAGRVAAQTMIDGFRENRMAVIESLRLQVERRQLDDQEAMNQFQRWHSTQRLGLEARLAEVQANENARAHNMGYGRDMAQMAVSAAVAQMPYLIPTEQLESAQAMAGAGIANAGREMGAPAVTPEIRLGGPAGTGADRFNFQTGGNMDPSELANLAVSRMQQRLGSGQVSIPATTGAAAPTYNPTPIPAAPATSQLDMSTLPGSSTYTAPTVTPTPPVVKP